MINQFKKYIFFIFLILTIFFTGCSKKDQRIINNFNNRPNDFEQTKNNVTVETKFLSHEEFNAIFKSPSFWVRTSSSKNYQAIFLSIKNLNANSYSIDSSSIKLELIPPEKMFELLKANALARGIVGTAIYPILGLVSGVILGFVMAYNASNIALTYTAFSLPFIFLGVGIYFAVKSYLNPVKQNKRLNKKLSEKSLDFKKEKIIEANETFNAMLFVDKKNLKTEFPILLLDPTTKENILDFNILVPAPQLCN